MKALFFSLFLLCSFSAISQQSNIIAVNNIKTVQHANGSLFMGDDFTDAGYFVPYTGANSPGALFSGGIWMAGLDPSQNLKSSYLDYGGQPPASNPYVSGPANADDIAVDFDKVWKVEFDEIMELLADFEDGSVDDVPSIQILEWPGSGNPYYNGDLPIQPLAPFNDQNADGIYNPYDGDYPAIEVAGEMLIPGEILYTVYFDKGDVDTSTGIEVHSTMYAFGSEDDPIINNTLFHRLTLINKSIFDLDQFVFSYWLDADVGCFDDDYLGCDPNRNTHYHYNSKAYDGSVSFGCLGNETYEDSPPVITVTFLNQDLSSFLAYEREDLASSPATTINSVNPIFRYNGMRALWADGTPMTRGGSGYNPGSTEETKFMFPDLPTDQSGWNLVNENPFILDYRAIPSVSKDLFLSGEMMTVDVALKSSFEDLPNHLDLVEIALEEVDYIQGLYDIGDVTHEQATNSNSGKAGMLDLSFGDAGKMITIWDEYDDVSVTAIAEQADGKILLLGNTSAFPTQSIIAQYLTNGQLDTDFGDGGNIAISISDFRTDGMNMKVDENNNILLHGLTLTDNFESKSFVLRLNSEGVIDSSFADNGVWLDDSAFSIMERTSDNKIMLAGGTTMAGDTTASCYLARLDSDGALDMDFGNGGYAHRNVGDLFRARFLKENSNGDLIAGGNIFNDSRNIGLAKFDKDGVVDNTFGNDGAIVESSMLDEFSTSMALQADGKIVVGLYIENIDDQDFGLIRYNQDGSRDNSFGTNGRVTTDFLKTDNASFSIQIQEDQKILLFGEVGTSNEDFALSRYNSNGDLDLSFGEEGRVLTDFCFRDFGKVSLLQSDGKLVGAGMSITSNDHPTYSIARYLTIDDPDSIDESYEFENLNNAWVIPNPNKGSFSLQGAVNGDRFVVVDISGNQIHAGVVDGSPINLRLAPNVYFIRLQSNDSKQEQILRMVIME